MTEYEFERYIATKDNVLQILNNFGVEIIPNLLDDSECECTNNGIWNTLETLSQQWEKQLFNK